VALLVAAGLTVLGLRGCPENVEVARPALRPSPPPPELPVSVAELPIEVDLRGALAALETQVPRVVDETQEWTYVADGRLGLKYRVERSPFAVAVKGSELQADFHARYAADACLRMARPWPFHKGYVCPRVAGCGQKGEPPTLALALRSTLSWRKDWRLASRSRYSLAFPTPCRVTVLRYDVTQKLERALAGPLDAGLAQLDARVPELTDLRPQLERVWGQLRAPLSLGSGVWLALRPSAVRVTPPEGRGLKVGATLGVTVQPLLSVGAAPEVPPAPLPPLSVHAATHEPMQLALDAHIGFAELGTRLREQLRGRELSLEGQRLRIDDVGVEGSGGGALLRVHVTLRTGVLGLRRVKGDVYLTARPRYDAASGMLVLDDVEYALGTEDRLVQLLERWGHGTLREQLMLRARFPVRAQLERLRGLAERGLQRELAPGLRLEGEVEGFTPLGVYAQEDGFVVRGQARGRLTLHVDTAVLLRPRAAP
jgi:hypothetical protein